MPQKGRQLLALAFVFGLMALMAAPAMAQVLYGSVVGTVQDPTGAMIPNATVTITNKGTGATRDAAADDQGRFTFVNVLAGQYDMKVVAQGFKSINVTGIDVPVNTVTRRDVKLEIGGLTETVSVTAEAVQLQTDRTDVRHALTTTTMSQLPVWGAYRNYQALINLVPGATPADHQNATVDTPARALRSFVNGTATNNNNTLVDGAANTNIWLPHHTYYVQPIDSIAEVNISTGSFDAEQGITGGAAITVITKSGTNDLHGSGSWFHNNQHLNSGAFTKGGAYRKPLLILNQVNGTLGGPIKKDSLFYFVSYERLADRTGYEGNYSVAPEDFRRGDFSQWEWWSKIYDPATQVGTNVATRTQFPGNKIPVSRISPITSSIFNQLPMPNQVSPTDPNNLGGNYYASGVQKLDRHMLDTKINWNASSKLAVNGKLSYMNAPVAGKYVFGDLGGPALGTHGFGDTKTYIPTGGFTYTLSPTFIVDGVFGYTRQDQEVGIPGQDSNVGLDVWKIPGTNGGRQYADDRRYGGLPNIQDFGFSNIGVDATWAPLFRAERTYEFRTNFSKIKGAHEMRWGFEARRYQMNHWQPEAQNPRGTIAFGGGATNVPGQTSRTSNAFASALLGLTASYNKSIQYFDMKTREWLLGGYFQDRWQISRKLTINLGMRYEYFPLINRDDRGIERWDPYTNLVYLGGLGDVPRNAGITTSKKLFAPRVGFAYRPTEQWVIRAGYGISYDPLPFSRPLRGQYPATLSGSWSASSGEALFSNSTYGYYNNIAQGIPDVPTPDVSKGIVELPLGLDMGLFSPWGGEINRGYIQSWNFTVGRRLPWDTVLDAAYVGTRTINQLVYRNINTNGPGEDAIPNNRYLAKLWGKPKSNAMYMWDGSAYGAYDSLQVSLNKSFSKGLFLKGAYTWSKALNMADEDGWASLKAFHWDPMISRNYSYASYDRPHMFTLGWVYEIPVGKGQKVDIQNKVLDLVAGGWKVNGMFSSYAGTPFTVTASATSLRCNGCSQTADQVAPVRKIDTERGPNKPFYDPASFSDPLTIFNKNGVYRPGTMGWMALRGPGFWRLDPALFKEFAITERIRTEFRAEAINFTNTPRWNNPGANASGPVRDTDGNITNLQNFMAITSTFGGTSGGMGGTRVVRFGLRVAF
jgi:hypothetical protein